MASVRSARLLGDICRFQAGDAFGKDEQGQAVGDHPFIKVSDMNLAGNEIYISRANNWVSDEDASSKYRLHPRDAVVFAKIGIALTYNRRRRLTRPTILDNNMMSAVCNPDIDATWFYYLLSTIDFNLISSGSALPYLTVKDLSRISVEVPSRSEQDAIAKVLGSLDDKIDLNRRMNETLEAMVLAIFKDWFVDFGPTRAKMDGRAPYLAPEIWTLFPDKLDDEGRPRSWKRKKLDELFHISIGRTPPRKEHEHFVVGGAGRSWLSIRSMGDLQIFAFRSEEDLTPNAVSRFNVPTVPAGTVLVSFKLTVGRVAIAAREMHTNEAIAHLVRAPGTPVSSEYAYCFMKAFNYESLGSTSSIATAVNSQSIRGIEMLVPGVETEEAFSTAVEPMFSLVRANCEQSRMLEAMRDLLLPKLISGEIRVRDAEKIAEMAA